MEHKNIEYKEFLEFIEKKEYEKLDFSKIKIQKYYVFYSIYKNNNIDYQTIIKNFNSITKSKFILSQSQLSKIKNEVIDNLKDLDLYQLVNKIKEDISDLYIYVNDIKYEVIIKNKNVEREERIIYFGLKKYLANLNYENTIEFFFDITFKIIPKKFYPYKLCILSGIPIKENIPRIITFILVKYLYENFKFNPKIIHTDFEKAIQKAICQNKYFKKTIIHSRCLFHYSKMIRGKLQKIGYCKRKLNKKKY